jgi:uncharacterized damage-inducible protein DinB
MTDPRYPMGKFAPPEQFTPALRAGFIADIAAVPAALRRALEGLSVEQRRTPYREGGWTVAQVVHHLADSHMNAYVRIKLALTELQPTIKPYNENQWAQLPDASDADVEDSLRLLEALHSRWATMATHLKVDDFERTMVHPERGLTTIDRTFALYAWHGRHHVAHIASLRERMGW